MSMPPVANWRYDYQPEAASPEAALLSDFLPIKAWLV
jgi:coproporphyrinogen III oxidase